MVDRVGAVDRDHLGAGREEAAQIRVVILKDQRAAELVDQYFEVRPRPGQAVAARLGDRRVQRNWLGRRREWLDLGAIPDPGVDWLLRLLTSENWDQIFCIRPAKPVSAAPAGGQPLLVPCNGERRVWAFRRNAVHVVQGKRRGLRIEIHPSNRDCCTTWSSPDREFFAPVKRRPAPTTSAATR